MFTRVSLIVAVNVLIPQPPPTPPPHSLVGELGPHSRGMRRNNKKKKDKVGGFKEKGGEKQKKPGLTDLKGRYQGRLQHSATLYRPQSSQGPPPSPASPPLHHPSPSSISALTCP